MSMVSKLCAALAAAGMFALVAFAPSVANAHAGHRHAATTETRAVTKTDTAKTDIAKSAYTGAAQEVRAAGIANPHAQHDGDCGDRGCCGNGHCSSCCNALAPSAMTVTGAAAKWLRLANNADLPPGLGTSGPPRPPRSFV